jgi:hypothetical protein
VTSPSPRFPQGVFFITYFCVQNKKNIKNCILIFYRYAYPWWKEKVIDSDAKRKDGLCPLTPEETALVLQALGIDRGYQIYIAAGEIYGGQRRMAALTSAYPNVVSSSPPPCIDAS